MATFGKSLFTPLHETLSTNFFQPTCKLVAKERVGAKVHKKYDTAQTPYQRLLKTGVLDQAHQ